MFIERFENCLQGNYKFTSKSLLVCPALTMAVMTDYYKNILNFQTELRRARPPLVIIIIIIIIGFEQHPKLTLHNYADDCMCHEHTSHPFVGQQNRSPYTACKFTHNNIDATIRKLCVVICLEYSTKLRSVVHRGERVQCSLQFA